MTETTTARPAGERAPSAASERAERVEVRDGRDLARAGREGGREGAREPAGDGRRGGMDPLFGVRTADIEPYTGLRYLSKLFRMIAVVLVLLLIAEVVTGLTQQGLDAISTLLAEVSRLIVLAGLLWGAGDLAILLIDVGHDVRAARILLGRQSAHHLPPTGDGRGGERTPARGSGAAAPGATGAGGASGPAATVEVIRP